jgi:hypothetical protein
VAAGERRDEVADARRKPVHRQPASVLSGRTIEQIAAEARLSAESRCPKKAAPSPTWYVESTSMPKALVHTQAIGWSARTSAGPRSAPSLPASDHHSARSEQIDAGTESECNAATVI